MATSGTIGQTQIDGVTIVDHAVRRCGVLPSLISGEHLATARENLFLQLTALTNRGLNLWCIKKNLLVAVPYLQKYPLQVGVVDLMRALWRYGTSTPATSYLGAVATIDYGAGNTVNVVSGVITAPAAGTYNLLLESSPDSVTWTQRGTARYQNVALGDQIAVDSESGILTRYWRVSETALVVTVVAGSFLSAATEVPMSKFNKDQYETLPNKNFASTQVLQYWFDKQDVRPYMWVWPVALQVGPQVVLWTQTQIQDVGDLSNTLQVPQRWLDAIIAELAAVTALELPASMVPQGRAEMLAGRAEIATRSAEDGERDGSPILINPGIGVYTR